MAIRPLGGRGFKRQWHAVTLRNQPVPPFLTEFLNLAVELLSQERAANVGLTPLPKAIPS